MAAGGDRQRDENAKREAQTVRFVWLRKGKSRCYGIVVRTRRCDSALALLPRSRYLARKRLGRRDVFTGRNDAAGVTA
jgi:hypothetical protein